MTLLKLAGALIAIAVVGPLLWSLDPFPDSDFIVSVTAFSIGIVAFLGTLTGQIPDEARMPAQAAAPAQPPR